MLYLAPRTSIIKDDPANYWDVGTNYRVVARLVTQDGGQFGETFTSENN